MTRDQFIPDQGGFTSNVDTEGSHYKSLQTINGYFISPHFSLGVGMGLESYRKPTINTLPVFLDARAYLSDEANSLYSYIDMGPTLRLGGEDTTLRKGFMFNVGIDYKFLLDNRLILVSDLFYGHKTISLTEEGIGTSDNKLRANGVGISIGVLF